MGKGEIQSHIGSGQYSVKLVYAYRARITAKLASLQKEIDAITVKIAAETDPAKLAILKLQKASMQRRYDYYSTGMPEDPTVDAWCADLTEDLSGNVGTIEIPGEPAQIIIRPGYDSRATYSQSRDGQLMPAIAGEPNQVLFNWMLLPGWQRHMPIYRVGTIESVDYSADTATVCLDPAFSSQQYLSAVDGFDDEGCSAANPVESQIADFCSRNPGHPLCTNTEAGEPINLSEAQLAQLQLVNQQVNQEFGRAQDPSGYKLGDSWDVLSGGDKGDCEDFALTKMQRLVDTYGWNPRDLKVVTAYVPHIGEYHAMLGIRTTNRGLVLLDINNDAVLQNSKTPYRLHRIALTKEEWTAIARRIEGAAVEYMTCNALAFVSGDRVVVEFPSQNYTAPKVVGFEEEPRACEFELYNFYHMPKGGITRWHSWSLDLLTRVTTNTTDTDIAFRYGVASFRLGNGIFLCGGIKPRTGYSDVIKEVLKFSPMSKSYSTRTDMPNPGRKDAAGFAVLGKGVVIGGAYFYDLDNINPYSDVDAYDDTTEAWTSKTDCPVARMGHRGFELNNKTHVLCGSEGMFKESGAYYEKIGGGHRSYDLSGDFWETKESISENRAYHQSCALGGYGLTFGGRIEGLSSPNTKNNHKYDQALDSWEQIATREIGTGFGYRYARGAVDTAYVPHSEGSYLEYSLSGDSYVGRTIEYPSLAEFYTYISGELA